MIHVKPYHFFRHTGDLNAPPGLDKQDQDDRSGVDLSNLNSKNRKTYSNGLDTMGNGVCDVKSKEKEDSEKDESEKNSEVESNGVDTKIDSESTKTEDEVEENKEQPEKSLEVVQNLENNGIKEDSAEAKNETSATKEETEKTSTIEKKETNENSEDNKENETKEKNSEVKQKEIEDLKENSVKEESKTEKQSEVEPTDEQLEEQKKENTEPKTDTENEEIENKECETNETDKEDVVEVEDPDSYLMDLECILKRIHKEFYERYDEMESGQVPDLKVVIPMVKSLVLKGTKLYFSGLVPTHQKLEQSKPYLIAKSLGAEVTQDLEEDSTHLVAIRPGTAKVNTGMYLFFQS